MTSPNAAAKGQPSNLSPFRSRYAPDFVHIIVGLEKKDDGVHKGGFICELSKYFKAAFDDSFSEASSGILRLPEESTETFELVYTSLYSNKITRAKDGEDTLCTARQLVDLWIFGDKYDMPALCNYAVNGLIKKYEQINNVIIGSFTHLYKNTLPDSLLRKTVLATYLCTPAQIETVLEKYPQSLLDCPELLLDYTRALVKDTTKYPKNDPRRILDPCQYHRHADGEKCT